MRAVLLLLVALFPVAAAVECIELCADAQYLLDAEYTLDVASVVTCASWTSAAMTVLPGRTFGMALANSPGSTCFRNKSCTPVSTSSRNKARDFAPAYIMTARRGRVPLTRAAHLQTVRPFSDDLQFFCRLQE